MARARLPLHLKFCITNGYTRSILNCKIVSKIVDRTYVYDNSVDNVDAKLLYRMVDGKLFKLYVEAIPAWAETIIG